MNEAMSYLLPSAARPINVQNGILCCVGIYVCIYIYIFVCPSRFGPPGSGNELPIVKPWQAPHAVVWERACGDIYHVRGNIPSLAMSS